MFDILLINPPIVNPGKIKKIRAISPPLGILSLAAYLESKDVSVKILDLALEPELYDSLKHKLDNPRPFIGITRTTNTIGSALDIARLIKDNNPDAFIVFGGPHPSILPEDVLKSDQVDCVVIGEGEYVLYNLFSSFKYEKGWETTHGIAFRNDGRVVINSHYGYIEELDTIPFPASYIPPMS